jgi:UV DNA damage endonuclease
VSLSWRILLPALPTKSTRTCRINTILKRGLDFAKDLGIQNVKDLAKLIQVGSARLLLDACRLMLLPMSLNPIDLSIQWNEENGLAIIFAFLWVKKMLTVASLSIRFLRISSELFPFASHVKYGYDLDYAAAELKVSVLWPVRSCQEPKG